MIDYEDESKLAEVKVWENAFEEFMNAYVNKSSNKNLTISYSSNPETYAWNDPALTFWLLFKSALANKFFP